MKKENNNNNYIIHGCLLWEKHLRVRYFGSWGKSCSPFFGHFPISQSQFVPPKGFNSWKWRGCGEWNKTLNKSLFSVPSFMNCFIISLHLKAQNQESQSPALIGIRWFLMSLPTKKNHDFMKISSKLTLRVRTGFTIAFSLLCSIWFLFIYFEGGDTRWIKGRKKRGKPSVCETERTIRWTIIY